MHGARGVSSLDRGVHERPLRLACTHCAQLALLIGAQTLFALLDATDKALSRSMDILPIALARHAGQAPIGWTAALARRTRRHQPVVFDPRLWVVERIVHRAPAVRAADLVDDHRLSILRPTARALQPAGHTRDPGKRCGDHVCRDTRRTEILNHRAATQAARCLHA